MIAINSTFAQNIRTTYPGTYTVEVVVHREDPENPFPSMVNALNWRGDMTITVTESGLMAGITDTGGLDTAVSDWATKIGRDVPWEKHLAFVNAWGAIVKELATGTVDDGGVYKSFELPPDAEIK